MLDGPTDDVCESLFCSIGDLPGMIDEHLWIKLDTTSTSIDFKPRLLPSRVRVQEQRDVALVRRQQSAQKRQMVAMESGCLRDAQRELVRKKTKAAHDKRSSRFHNPRLPLDWPRVQLPEQLDTAMNLPKMSFLRSLNRHPRDSRIVFFLQNHILISLMVCEASDR